VPLERGDRSSRGQRQGEKATTETAGPENFRVLDDPPAWNEQPEAFLPSLNFG